MGLEVVEFVIDVEKAFGLSIPEQVVEGLLAKSVWRGDISLDTELRSIFS